MSLSAGDRLGPYEVAALIGRGGMGEVFRAHDTRLKRDVAIKVLPADVAADSERIARFEREAQLLAALNHPGIAAIHGVEHAGRVTALVMELVDGPTLAELIVRGPYAPAPSSTVSGQRAPDARGGPHGLRRDDVVSIARQIAMALEAAHERGIVHRDLKPDNVKVRDDGTVKVLDFGLAKAMLPEGGVAPAGDMNQSPTITSPAMTRQGVVLGTAAYMSPEQARGQSVDRGADIWAFGCVLYEMLTGRRAFDGDTVSETVAAILRDEPAWSRLPSDTPPGVRRVLRRCLEKDRRRRLADIRDARLDLEDAPGEIGAEIGAPIRQAPLNWRERVLWLVGLGTLGGLALWLGVRDERQPSADEVRLELHTPPTTEPTSLAISPDGRLVAFVALAEGRSMLWVYRLANGASQPIRGTEDATFPFWSPDSRTIGFFAAERLKTVALDGGMPAALAPAIIGTGGTWAPDGRILFPFVPDSPLMVASAGIENQAVQPAMGSYATGTAFGGERFPQMLPDGQHYLYYVAESRGVYLGSLDRPERIRLFEADAAAVVAGPSEVIFVRDGVLYAQTFDMRRYSLEGEPVRLATGVGEADGAAPVSASMVRSVAYRTGSVLSQRQLVWFDRAGLRVGAVGELYAGHPVNLSLSPDGRRLALNRAVEGNTDIHVFSDLARGIGSRFTLGPTPDIAPVWSPDGRSLMFSQAIAPDTPFALHVRSMEGDQEARPIVGATPSVQIAMDWKGDLALFRTQDLNSKTGWDIWSAHVTGDPRPTPVVRTPFDDRNGQLSPDAQWIAYESNKSGDFEIYLRRFDGRGEEMPVSKAGGVQPRWNPTGKELFYLAPDGWLMAVALVEAPTGQRTLGIPRRLFAANANIAGGHFGYAVAPGGDRFLVSAVVEHTHAPIWVILNRRPLGAGRSNHP